MMKHQQIIASAWYTYLIIFGCISLEAPQDSDLVPFSSKRAVNFSYPDTNFSHSFHCSRLASRRARHFLDDHFWWYVDKYNFILPDSCPFSDTLDIFDIHESNKQRLRHSQWKCNICQKEFVSEYYADMHMDSKHYHLMPMYNDTNNVKMKKHNQTFVCLADYCDILRCSDSYNEIDHAPKQGIQCRPAQMKSFRNQCYHIMHQCFPYRNDDTNNELKSYFIGHLCDTLKCEIDSNGINSDDSINDNNVVHATLNASQRSRYMYKICLWLALFVLTLFVVATMCIIQIASTDNNDPKTSNSSNNNNIKRSSITGYPRTKYGRKHNFRGVATQTLRKVTKLTVPATAVKMD